MAVQKVSARDQTSSTASYLSPLLVPLRHLYNSHPLYRGLGLQWSQQFISERYQEDQVLSQSNCKGLVTEVLALTWGFPVPYLLTQLRNTKAAAVGRDRK